VANSTLSPPPHAALRTVAWPIPRPRRFTVGLGVLASAGVATSSLRAAPLVLLVPLGCLWLCVFLLGALWQRGGPAVLGVVAVLVKVITAVLIVWAITHPHSPLGPHDALDWVPLGALNAATGIWWLRIIRHQAR
jgi:hypothetical protein